MSCKFFSISTYDYIRNTCLHYIWWIGASSVSPYVIAITWGITSDIIIHHWSIAYELFTSCASLIYFSVAIVTTAIKLSYYCATNTLLQIFSSPGVVELTTQLLILKNILWLPLCRINKFGLNTLPSKVVVIPYTCGLSISMCDRVCFLR